MKITCQSIELYSSHRELLGEGPLWCAQQQALFWLDIGRKTLHRQPLIDASRRSWPLPDFPGCLAELDAASVAIAMGEGTHRFNVGRATSELLCRTPSRRPATRFNDGKVDPQGRFWAVTMQNNFGPNGEAIAIERSEGTLYRFDADGSACTMEEDISIGNTLAWSPDLKRFYFADSLKGQIFVYDFDAESGAICHKRLFFETSGRGIPDGSAMDTDGCLWNARWDGNAMLRITPEGKVDRVIELPVPRPTSCCFGGPRLDTLFVTSASLGLSAAVLEQAPLSGAVFAIEGLGQGMPIPALDSSWSKRQIDQSKTSSN